MSFLSNPSEGRTWGRYDCRVPGCGAEIASKSGLTQHTNRVHRRIIRSRRFHQPAPASVPSSVPPPPVQHHSQSLPVRQPPQDPQDHSPPRTSSPPSFDFFLPYKCPPITFSSASKCNVHGEYVSPSSQPDLPPPRSPSDWFPFNNQVEFETADLLYRRVQMSATHIDALLAVWGASLTKEDGSELPPPFLDHDKMYKAIDKIEHCDVAWETFNVSYQGPRPSQNIPTWMDGKYDVWFRDPREVIKNILSRPDMKDDIDLTPYRDYDEAGVRQYENMFSGDWAWDQATRISEDPSTHGATFVPFIMGSDKTTVSVATGATEYYPLYISPGNIHNTARRARRNAVALVGFLSVPKADESCADDPQFRHFRRQLYHTSLSTILQAFKPGMTQPEVVLFGDGHYRRVVWGVGPYIADYPEQVLLAGIVQGWCPRCLAFPDRLDDHALRRCQEHTEALIEEYHPGVLWSSYGIIANVVPFTNDFPRADIHELIAPDLLHQLIKGTFKDHLVEWVCRYLKSQHTRRDYKKIMADIDRRIAVAAPFAGLRRFPQGRGFKQWTGDDSKALMKVYLPAIENHVPDGMVRAVRAFLEFCYLVRRNTLTDTDITALQRALDSFHHHRESFRDFGVTLSLPRQHSLVHYIYLVQQFGAPNGLCSSITESKHIEAVKEPWRRSSRFNALGQMLTTNQRLDKLKAARVDFAARGMLNSSVLPRRLRMLQTLDAQDSSQDTQHAEPNTTNGLQVYEPVSCSVQATEEQEEPEVDGTTITAEVNLAAKSNTQRARDFDALAAEISVQNIRRLTRRFLYAQLHPDITRRTARSVRPQDLPNLPETLRVYDSAVSIYRAPSDLCGSGGLKRERIRSTPLWRNEAPRNDCAFVVTRPDVDGIFSMEVARILAFFSFRYEGCVYPCAVVHWYNWDGDERDENTGMYVVRPSMTASNSRHVEVVHVDSLVRGAHLLPVFGGQLIPKDMKCYHSLDSFEAFYVNRFADHHAYELA
ncbi:hypothetical protein CONPUDRAFT_129795 [Coniophora puteana RWD-64-598 SS2]|uniref:C2H2-type domain-containing protein n=1 Tax=Coniophora puteana (strain RWD-64-598) TaxID=741705 RepID=A0A5M3MCB4_CONPW|nr:uncharacterized protein CONPUDRAFT_129795 [Coniophora puteana RWD-64-598 SS2]EIW76544.1 hypothetical protein CONPUDRAFT_129795 [Coniophora puteana RWD-64-598 SS2]